MSTSLGVSSSTLIYAHFSNASFGPDHHSRTGSYALQGQTAYRSAASLSGWKSKTITVPDLYAYRLNVVVKPVVVKPVVVKPVVVMMSRQSHPGTALPEQATHLRNTSTSHITTCELTDKHHVAMRECDPRTSYPPRSKVTMFKFGYRKCHAECVSEFGYKIHAEYVFFFTLDIEFVM